MVTGNNLQLGGCKNPPTLSLTDDILTLAGFLQGNVFRVINTIIFPKWHDCICFEVVNHGMNNIMIKFLLVGSLNVLSV